MLEQLMATMHKSKFANNAENINLRMLKEKLCNLYLKQNKLLSFLEEDQEHQNIESSYINLAIANLKAQQEKEASLLSNSYNTTQEIYTELDSPEDSIDENNIINITNLFGKLGVKNKGKEKISNIKDEEVEEQQKRHKEQEEKSQSYQRVLIYGKAGIGKTTLMNYITYKWAQGELWNQFDYVFLLPFGKLNNYFKKNEYDGIENFIIECCLNEGVANLKISEDIKRIQSILNNSKVLLLFDGYDEFVPQEENRKFVRSIFEAALSHKRVSIIMTSRPNRVESRYIQLFDYQLVNMGFSNTNIYDYIEKNFKGIEEDKQKLHQLIRQNKAIQGMCHTPLNLHLLCLLWVDLLTEQQGKINSQRFSTTKLYVEIVDWLIRRYVIKTQNRKLANAKNLKHTQLEKDYENIFKIHERIAYEGLKQGKAVLDKGLLSKLGVIDIEYGQIQEIGLLKAIDENEQEDQEPDGKGKGKEKNIIDVKGNMDKKHYFIHLTFQEYMAARCLVRMLNSKDREQVREAVEFLDNNKYVQRYERMIGFIVGIVSLDKEQSTQPSQGLLHFWNVIVNGKVDLGILKQLNLIIKCINESGIDERIPDIRKIKNYLKNTIMSIREAGKSKAVSEISEELELWLGITKIVGDKEREIKNLLMRLSEENGENRLKTIEIIRKIEVNDLEFGSQKQLMQILLKIFTSSQNETYTRVKEVLSEIAVKLEDVELKILINNTLASEELRQDKFEKQIKKWVMELPHNVSINDCIEGLKDKKQMVNILVPLLKNENNYVCIKAAEVLNILNIENVEVQAQIVDVVVSLVQVQDKRVSDKAIEVLSKIDITDRQVQIQIAVSLIPLLTDNVVSDKIIEVLSKIDITSREVERQLENGFMLLLEGKNYRSYGTVASAWIKLQTLMFDTYMFQLKDKNNNTYITNVLVTLRTIDFHIRARMVEIFVPSLKSANTNVCLCAAEALSDLNITDAQLQRQIIFKLISLFGEQYKNISKRAAAILIKLNITDYELQAQMINSLVSLLGNKDGKIGKRAATVLIKLNISNSQIQMQMVNNLMILFREIDWVVRNNVVLVLCKLNITDSKVHALMINSFIPLLRNKDENISRRVGTILFKLNITDSEIQAQMVNSLISLFGNKDKNFNRRVSTILCKLNIIDSKVQAQIVAALIPFLEDKYICLNVAEALSKTKTTGAQIQRQIVAAIVLLLEGKSNCNFVRALKALSRLNITDLHTQVQIAKVLLPLLENMNSSDFNNVAKALARLNITDPKFQIQLVNNFVSLLRDEDNNVHNKIAEALIMLNITDSQAQLQIVNSLVNLVEKDSDVRDKIMEALIILNITDPRAQVKMVSSFVPLIKNWDEATCNSAVKILSKLNIKDAQIQAQMMDALVPLLKESNQRVADNSSLLLCKLNIFNSDLQSTLLSTLLNLFEDAYKNVNMLTNIIKVLDSLQITGISKINISNLIKKLLEVLKNIDQDNKKINRELEVIKLRVMHILNKLLINDPIILKEAFTELLQNFIFNKPNVGNSATYIRPLLNLFLERLLILNVRIHFNTDLMILLSLPLFKQAAVVVDEDKVIINYRGYLREMPFAEGENKADMAYHVFNYFYQQHQLSGVATELLDQRLNFSKAIQISKFDIELGNITLAKSVLQAHSYSCVNNTTRLNCQQWMISIIRKSRNVGNSHHAYLVIEGRNVFHEAELYRLELLQPNAAQFPERGRIEIMEEAHIDVSKQGELARVFQIVLGNTHFNGNNGFEMGQDYHHKSCLVTREIAMQIIDQAKEEKVKAAEVTYDLKGIKAPNCFTWARKKLKDNLEANEYQALKIEGASVLDYDPITYLGLTVSTIPWVTHYMKDGAKVIGKVFGGK